MAGLQLFSARIPVWNLLELAALDVRFRIRGPVSPGNSVAIVAVDEVSLQELGRWPWSRRTLNLLLRRLAEARPRVLALDVLFIEPEPSRESEDLEELRAALGEAAQGNPKGLGPLMKFLEEKKAEYVEFTQTLLASGNGVLPLFFRFEGPPMGQPLEGFPPPELLPRSTVPLEPGEARRISALQARWLLGPLLPLARAAKRLGHVNAGLDAAGGTRWEVLLVEYGGRLYPSLGLQAAAEYWGADPLQSWVAPDRGIYLGGRWVPADEHLRMALNFYGPEGSFPVYPARDVLAGRVPEGELKDRVVFVGATAAALLDRSPTPFSASLPGVERHATVVANLLQGTPLIRETWMRFLDAAAILLVGLALALWLPRLPAVAGGFVAGALVLLYLSILQFLFVRYRLWLDSVGSLLGAAGVYASVLTYRSLAEQRERQFVRQAFSQYLSPEVIDELLADPSRLRLGGETRVLTTLFIDVEDSTAFAERVGPEDLVEWLNRYFTSLTDVIFKWGGTVDKIVGDAMVAFFGAPLPQTDHAQRACHTALDILERVKGLEAPWQKVGLHGLRLRIGLSSGPMVVGNMGSSTRMVYTVSGDPVNLCARLQKANKIYGTEILLSDPTEREVEDAFELREIDAVRVRGKQRQVLLYELVGVKGRLDPVSQEAFQRYREGLALYRQGRWSEAAREFEGGAHLLPRDGPCRVMASRCRDFLESPPPSDWDGAFLI